MRRIKMIIEYDGTNYHGSQIQANGHTIQAEMQQCIERLTGEKTSILFAGRTDTGVHALGQVVAFDTEATIPPDRWQYALNSFLPDDIKVLHSTEVAASFHPRFDAVSKSYRYKIYRKNRGQTLWRNYAFLCTDKLNLEAMREAARCLEGSHDFRSFCASGSSVKNFERKVLSCRLEEAEPFLYLDITANGFLYNMVRIIMGTLLEVGRGNLAPGDIDRILAARDRSLAGPTAPPQGLYLMEVHYS
ncbi:MAG TPA: tRNA pseudouridine(38-40) synthase TruA [Syntrophomonadaceae bacterium]|nr:tRNA pseudouridine(38-40) synthase TruA [Syntrophomonadaceae bacterium]HQE23628.1 tRNA pseudouridine(38-40) synthase TruA [Syntrophomonadaceae bacterium]